MLALIEEIKNSVILLGNDSEPEDLQMRASMGITIELMKELRNTIVESGQYSELVTSRASQTLAECRSELGLLYRTVPCHAEGCPVTEEVQRYFLQVMNGVIVAFDYLIEKSLSNRNSRHPNPQNGIRETKAGHHSLMLFKKLISKRKSSERRLKTELDPRDYLEAELRETELELGKIWEKTEQLKSSITALESKYSALRRDVSNSRKRSNLNLRKLRVKVKHSRHSRSQIPDYRQAKPRWVPENGKESNGTSSTSSEFDLSELSNVAMVGSYQTIGSNPLQVLWVHKDHHKFLLKSTSSDFRFNVLTQLESKSSVAVVDSFQNIESESSLRMENSQDLHTSCIPTSSTSSDFIFKHLPHLKNDKSQTSLATESQPELQVLWERKEKPMVHTSSTSSHLRFIDLLQNDGSATHFQIDSPPREQSLIQTISTFSEFLPKDLPQVESVKNQPSLITESPLELQVQRSFTSSHLEPQNDGSARNSKTDGLIQTVSTSFDLHFKDLPQQEQMESQPCLTADNSQDLQLIHIASSSSNCIHKELPKPEIYESQTSLTAESSQDLQVLCVQKDEPLVQTGSPRSDFLLKNLTEADGALVGSIQNIESLISLRMESGQDQAVFHFQKEYSNSKLQTSSDFIVEDKPQIDKNQPSLMIYTPENVQDWRSQMEKHTSQTSSTSSDLILKNLKELQSNIAMAGSISNTQGNSSLRCLSRQDLPVSCFQEDKPSIRTSFTYSELLLKDLLYPEKVETKTCLTTKSSNQLPVLLTRSDKPMANLSFFSADLSVENRISTKSRQIVKPKTPRNVTLKYLVSAKKPTANTSQRPMTREKSSRHLETRELKPTTSYFSLGKTFGDHRLRLLRWCQEKTKKYGVPMYEFSESWRSGLALVAIIYSYRKDLIEDRFNPNRLIKESPRDILICGAKAAESLGLNSKVDIVRVCRQRVPDFCKVFTFVSELRRCLEQKLN